MTARAKWWAVGGVSLAALIFLCVFKKDKGETMNETETEKQEDINAVAKTIYGEARGEGNLGMTAVAAVIGNRKKSGKWFGGRTYADVVYKPWQFSVWNPVTVDNYKATNTEKLAAVRANEITPKSNSAAAAAYTIAEMLINGQLPDPTQGATHYKRTDTPAAWAKGKNPVVTIGKHEFYKDID